MSDPAAITAVFSDYRLVKTRSTLQLVLEVPVERQAEAFAALGYPVPGKDIHVAVARLVSPGTGAEPEAITGGRAYLTPAEGALPDSGGRTVGSIPATGASHAEGSARHGNHISVAKDGVRPRSPEHPKERRPFHTLPAVQRAAMLCQDERFRAWIARRQNTAWVGDEIGAAEWLRAVIGVSSRSEITRSPDALQAFERIETAYMQDTGLMARAR